MRIGLSDKFSRASLYSRKSALGVGLMEPSTITYVLKLKLFIGNMRKEAMQKNPHNFSYNTKQQKQDEYKRLGENHNLRHWHKTWVDEINNILWKRCVTLKGEENE